METLLGFNGRLAYTVHPKIQCRVHRHLRVEVPALDEMSCVCQQDTGYSVH